MTRCVLDTNILISAVLWSGSPSHVLRLAFEKRFQALTSEILLEEFRDVIARAKFEPRLQRLAKTPDEIVDHLLDHLIIVDPAALDISIADDPDDDHVLACAVGGSAQYLVTGDPHLLRLSAYKEISIVTVNSFVEYLESADQ